MARCYQNKLLKRAAAFSSVCLMVLTCSSFAAEELQPYQTLAKSILAELVEINTTNSVGDNTAAAQAMANRLLAAGFPPEDVQVLAPAPRKGNLVARYRGKNLGLKPLLLLAHIDVVEADPADWTLAPFTFHEEGDYFIGRGVSDDKDEAAIHIANFIRMREEGFVPDRDIVVALTADEEGGEHNGVQWLLAEHPDLMMAEYALNEGGGGNLNDAGVPVSNTVQASEKVYQSYTLEVTNPGGHSSLPERDNAIYRLADALAKVRDYEFPIVLNQITTLYFQRRAELESGELAAALSGVTLTPPDPSAVSYFYDKPFYNSRLRTTCVATMFEAGHAENALPQRATATVNCRVLPDESINGVLATLNRVIDDPTVQVSPIAAATQSPVSPLTPPLLKIMETITDELWPGVPVLPTMSTGATDSLFLRNAGIPVYGVSGIFSDGSDGIHGQNERILIRSFFEGQEFLYRLTKALASATDGA